MFVVVGLVGIAMKHSGNLQAATEKYVSARLAGRKTVSGVALTFEVSCPEPTTPDKTTFTATCQATVTTPDTVSTPASFTLDVTGTRDGKNITVSPLKIPAVLDRISADMLVTTHFTDEGLVVTSSEITCALPAPLVVLSGDSVTCTVNPPDSPPQTVTIGATDGQAAVSAG